MSDQIYFDGVRYVAAGIAAEEAGLSSGHVTHLCRTGRISARQAGRHWYVDQERFRNFIAERQRSAAVRSEKLAQERVAEYQRLNAKKLSPASVRITRRSSTLIQLASFAGAVALTVGTLAGADAAYTHFAGSHLLPRSELAAAGSTDSFFAWLLSLWNPQKSETAYVPLTWQKTTVREKFPVVKTTPTPTPAPRPAPPSIVNNYPVVERIIERALPAYTIANGGVTEEMLNTNLNQLENKLSSRIFSLSVAQSGTASNVVNVYHEVAQSQRIDQLSGTTITNPTITGGNVTATAFSGTLTIGSGGTGTSSAPTYGKLLVGNGSGTYDLLATSTLGISSSPGGSDSQVQFNNGGSFAGNAGLTFASSTALLTVINITSTNSTSTNATSTNFFATNASTTNATSTSLFSVLGHFTTAVIDAMTNLTATNLVAINSTTTNATSTNLFVTNAVFTGATSTSFFATTASSTNLFAQTATLGSLTLGTTLTVANGGTGATTFGQGWIFSNGGTGALTASTSPTVNYLVATSTTVASTLPYASSTAITASGSGFFGNGAFTSSSGTTTVTAGQGFTIGSSQFVLQQGSGNVGIGTSSPFRLFSLTGAVSTAQAAVAYNTANATQFLTSSVGDLFVYPSGQDALFNDSNVWVCTGGSSDTNGCPSGTPSGQGNLIVETALGVASSTPWAAISVGSNGSITTTEKSLSDGATVAIDWKQGNQQLVTLGGNRTITFSNYIPGMTLRFVICQDATGSRTLTWPSGTTLLWSGGSAPTLTATANKCDVATFLTTAATGTVKVFGSTVLSF